MDFNAFKSAVAEAAKELGVTDYELYYTSGESTEVEGFGHEINDFTSSVDGGVSLRCAVGGRFGYASTEALAPSQARALVLRAMDNAGTLETEESALLVEGGQVYEEHEAPSYPLPDAAELKRTVLELQEKLLSADPMVLGNSQSFASSGRETVAIFNSRGLDVSFTAGMSSIGVAPIVGDGSEMSNDFEIKVGYFASIDVDEMVKKAVGRAKDKLGGGAPSSGAMPVVFSPEAMSALLGTFSPAFSSEAAQKGLSPLAKLEGQKIAGENITLVDDPFYKERTMPIPFDAEGSPAHRKNIIDAGKLVTLLYNMETAAKAGRSTTGNAAKAGYASKVGVMPFTMYLEPGTLSEEELLQKAGNGVYINMLGGLHAGANVISGDFSLQSGGFLIEDGKKTAPVKSFTVAGNFFELLKNITDVGANLELHRPAGITNFASPSVLAAGLSVAGK